MQVAATSENKTAASVRHNLTMARRAQVGWSIETPVVWCSVSGGVAGLVGVEYPAMVR